MAKNLNKMFKNGVQDGGQNGGSKFLFAIIIEPFINQVC